MKKIKVRPLYRAAVIRKTKETRVSVRVALPGRGKARVNTGIGFLDHMLTLLSYHGMMDLDVAARGDLAVDIHHTNDDVGITLGQALKKALGPKRGIRRYGFFYLPMDEALVKSVVALDISGRPSFHITGGNKVRGQAVRGLSKRGREVAYTLQDAENFLTELARHAGITLHVQIIAGRDVHHVLEGIFKGLGKALDMATQVDERRQGVPSTKGVI
ncbi:MAG: imidazoleglycerol-phosphate dehydratase HisB [Candidatus Omnitrophica bacterium]|nr:imidazoleglycerol-phosphate dehydratase HisB [Candidatus Omnitrophota bacterium]